MDNYILCAKCRGGGRVIL